MLGDKKIIHDHIKWVKKLQIVSIFSILLFSLFVILSIFPFIKTTETSKATATPATSTLNITSSSTAADIEIKLKHKGTSFAASKSNISFNVTTNNLTGYTLSIKGNNPSGELVNTAYGDKIDTVSSAVDSLTFANDPSTAYINKWGIRPNMFNSMPNTNYLPAPSTLTVLDVTSAPNTTAKKYTIDIAGRLDNTKSPGDYTDTFVLTALSNPISYEFKFLDNSPDAASVRPSLPGIESGISVSISSFTLPTKTPERTGYTFKSWCDGTVSHTTGGASSCVGDVYTKGASYSKFNDPANPDNEVDFYAMWEENTYPLTLSNNDATTSGSTEARVFYDNNTVYAGSSGTSAITNPSRSYTISGFTTNSNNASGATVSSTATQTYNYNFDGWYSSTPSTTKIISANKTLVANTPYTSSDGKWNSPSGAQLHAYWTTNGSITLPTITKTGHNCGWTTQSSGATAIEYATGYSGLIPTGNIKLYGVCIPDKIDVIIKTATGIDEVELNGVKCDTALGCPVSNLTYGQSYSLTAKPKDGYTFSNWNSSPYGSFTNPNAITTTYIVGAGDSTITPATTINKYDITIKPVANVPKVTLNGTECTNPSGCIVPNLTYGQTYSLSAEPAPGHSFSGWDAGAYGTIADPTAITTTYKVGLGNSTITPTDGTINKYNITIKPTTNVPKVTLNGTECNYPDSCIVPNLTYGQPYSLTAKTATGYTFSSWSTNPYGSFADYTADTTTYTIGAGDSTITPAATINKYNITIKPIANVSKVTLNGTECTYPNTCTVSNLTYGQTYSLSAEPAPGYSFSSWDTGAYGTVTNVTSATTTYTVGNGNSTITPTNGTANKYTITIKTVTGISEVELNGVKCDTALGCPVSNLTYGQSYNLIAKAAPGYTFSSWSTSPYGSFANSTADTTTYTVGAGNSTITPAATINKYNITIKTAPGIYSVTLDGKTTYSDTTGLTIPLTYGQTYNLTAEPNPGYVLSSWNAGAYGTIANPTATSTTYKVGLGNSTITLASQLITSKLTVDPNGGTWNGSTSSTVITKNYQDTYELTNPTSRPSYTGIAYNANSQGATFTPGASSIQKNFSSWAKTSGGGTLNGNKYTFGTSDGKVTANYSNPSLKLPKIEKVGHTCKWAKGSTSGTQIASEGSVTIDANDITFYAICTANPYTVNLSASNANNSYTNKTTATYGSKTLAAIATLPTRANGSVSRTVSFSRGTNASDATISSTTAKTSTATVTYTFTGWYKESAATTKVASDAKTPALSASVSGLTNASSQWIATTTQTLYAGWSNKTGTYSAVTLPTISKPGYDCSWNTKSDGTGTSYTSGYTSYTPGSSTVTLYGYCKAKTSNITLNNQLATTAGSTSTTATYNSSTLSPAITNPKRTYKISGFTLPSGNKANGATVTYSGSNCTSATACSNTYSFGGWYTATSNGTQVINSSGGLVANASGYTSNSKWVKEGNVTLYAHWSNGTTGLPSIKKDGHSCGWTTTSSSATSIQYASGYTGLHPTAPVTLYGVCTVNSYEVDVTAGDTTVSADKLSIPYGGSKNVNVTPTTGYYLSSVTCPKGYTCTGYSTGTDATKKQTVTVTNNNTTSGGTLKFAQKAKSFKITVNPVAGIETITLNGKNCSTGCSPSLTYGQSYTIEATMISGVSFSKWTAKKGEFKKDTSTSTTYTVPNSDDTITPTIKTPYIQDYTKAKCKANAQDSAVSLVDKRDSQIYTVRYYGGACWMTRNLAVGCKGTGTTYNGSRNSNLTISSSDTNTTKSSFKMSTDNINPLTDTNSLSKSQMLCTQTAAGAWYNYKAATIGEIKGEGVSASATESLCPKNWRLPTKDEASALESKTKTDKKVSIFKAVAGGRFADSSLTNKDTGYWWTSDYDSNHSRSERYFIHYLNSNSYVDRRGDGYRGDGFSIRCVAE